MKFDLEKWVRSELSMLRAFRNQILAGGNVTKAQEDTVNINKRNKYGETVLIGVIKYLDELSEQARWVHDLVQLGADVNAADKSGRTAMMHACIRNVPELGLILLDVAVNDLRVKDKNGNTAVMYCASYGHAELLHAMITRAVKAWGIDVFRTKNVLGNDAHKMAKMGGHHRCAKMLSRGRLVLLHRMYKQLALLNTSAKLRGWPDGAKASTEWKRLLTLSQATGNFRYADQRKFSSTGDLLDDSQPLNSKRNHSIV